ncbi:amino acid adenylation domain protein : Peptide synthetase (Fragment) OS=Cyanothece sp. CCY0110 GN=CY0110_07821 PE=4 SV=1: AMP-binding: AMP-binding_C [Gemmataceae bacterium]
MSKSLPADLSMGSHATGTLDRVGPAVGAGLSETHHPAADPREILAALNDTAADYPRDRRAHELIAEQAARTPGAVAVESSGAKLTYAELDARGNQFAHYLRKRGVGPDVLVGVCLDRTAEMVAALLGVWKAGGAYVPLDPDFPAERLKLYLEDSAAPVVVTLAHLAGRLPAGAAHVVDLDAERDAIGREPTGPLPHSGTPANLAYVIYTSGSTGRPNGVAVEHRALVNFLVSMQREPGLTRADVVAAVTTISFDIHHLELWLPLIAGARLAVLRWADAADGVRLAEELDRYGATVLQATPTRWRLLLAAGWAGRPGLRAFCGGEPMPPELAGRLLERVAEVWNLYGPTETTVWSTVHRVERAGGSVPIGHPIANTQVYVLDPQLEQLPAGEVGELYIGGDGLARHYLNRPELTANRFVADPANPGQRLYKTGDLARLRPDGVLECLGRIDHQVKVRGYRIELGEVESALASHPLVAAAVAHVTGDPAELVAYLVPRPGAAPTPEAVRQHARERVPAYMVPGPVVFLDALPMTPNGKSIARRSRPEPRPGPRGPEPVAGGPAERRRARPARDLGRGVREPESRRDRRLRRPRRHVPQGRGGRGTRVRTARPHDPPRRDVRGHHRREAGGARAEPAGDGDAERPRAAPDRRPQAAAVHDRGRRRPRVHVP